MSLNPQPPPKLESENVVIAAPLSFAGSTTRIRNRVEEVPDGPVKIWVVIPAAVLFLLVAWAFILCWYLLWGLWLVPYRLFRRGQRKREVAELRHREFMTAVHSQPPPYPPYQPPYAPGPPQPPYPTAPYQPPYPPQPPVG
jgi:hypothetical protein